MEQYIHSLGLLMEDVKLDHEQKLYILVEGHDLKGNFVFEKVYLPEEYQTEWNVDIIKDYSHE